jgi:hypothetical protein
MMKFLCLIRGESVFEPLSVTEAAKRTGEYAAYTEGIRRSGHYVGGNRLLPPSTGITLRVRNGKLTTTDGPYAETKEHLGGYYLIEARDLNEAILVAAKIPGARTGSIEVRPVAENVAATQAPAPSTPANSLVTEKEIG